MLILIAGYAFTWVFITLGLVSGNAQAAQGMSMLVIPFSFISSANVPIESMPGWMQPFAANQPISVIINAVRSLMQGGTDVVGIGHTTAYWVVLSLIWCAGIAPGVRHDRRPQVQPRPASADPTPPPGLEARLHPAEPGLVAPGRVSRIGDRPLPA